MMYIDAVCNGIDDIPTVDDHTRQLLKQRLADEGLEALCEELRHLDPEHYEVVDRKNPRRVVHALEICLMTGRTYTSFRNKEVRSKEKKEAEDSEGRPFRIIKIGLTRPRDIIYDRINRRVDQMMADDLLEEARQLYPLRHLNALNTVGYKEMFAYLDGTWTLEEAVERMKGNTRRYARKQLTWFKKDPAMTWFSPEDKHQIINYIEKHG
jgi:tRNA dimethylallyltransferase